MFQDQGLPQSLEGKSSTNPSVPGNVAPIQTRPALAWQSLLPYAAIVCSLIFTALGMYWGLSGHGFPYATGTESNVTAPILAKLGQSAAWIVVVALGIPAAMIGIAMLRGVRRFRLVFISAGIALAAMLFFLMTDLTLLEMLAYIPFTLFRFFSGADASFYLQSLNQVKWIIAYQLLCLVGGSIWLAATITYARQTSGACLSCGRHDRPESWTSPTQAARWGRAAVYASLVVPVLYAFTRYVWALGIPLGMTDEYWRLQQERGAWTSGLFLANVGLVGALLTLGLIQRWGESFPRWMIGLAGRRVPIALAVVPASLMAVLFMVSGVSVLSGWSKMSTAAATTGQNIWIVVGPVTLFPLWGISLAIATLGYYYRRRGPCKICGRGRDGNLCVD